MAGVLSEFSCRCSLPALSVAFSSLLSTITCLCHSASILWLRPLISTNSSQCSTSAQRIPPFSLYGLHSLRKSLPSSVTSPGVLLVLWFLFSSAIRFLMLYTAFLTLVFVLLGGWSLDPLCGLTLSWDVSAWTRACVESQRSKMHQHVHSAVPLDPVSARRFSHIHMDLLGPLPSSRSFTYLFTILDVTLTRGCSFVLHLSCCHGPLLWLFIKITSDCGAHFLSSILDVLCSLLNISHSRNMSFHPQSNSLVEFFNPT